MNQYKWIVIGVLVLAAIMAVVAYLNMSKRAKTPDDPVLPPAPDVDDGNAFFTVKADKPSREETLRILESASDRYEAATNRLVAAMGVPKNAIEDYWLALVDSLPYGSVLFNATYDAYMLAVDKWGERYVNVSKAVNEMLASVLTAALSIDTTTCTATTFVKDVKVKTSAVNECKVKQGNVLGFVASWSEETNTKVVNSETTISWTPNCTEWSVDPVLVIQTLEINKQAVQAAYGQIKTVIGQCPSIYQFVKMPTK